jgi:hypothetical protein
MALLIDYNSDTETIRLRNDDIVTNHQDDISNTIVFEYDVNFLLISFPTILGDMSAWL